MSQTKYSLKEFVIEEMRLRDMSARQFGKFVGVSNTTINRALDLKYTADPTLDFLAKLATATNTSLMTLIGLSFPDALELNQPSPAALIMAQKIEKLPAHLQEAIAAIIRGSAVES